MTVPMNEVNFKIQFDAKHEGGHYCKVKYDWISTGAPPATTPTTPPESGKPLFDTAEVDTGFLRDWNLVQIEGEEPVEAVVEEANAKAPPKKAPPPKEKGKAGGTPHLEEITDNRPREINYIKNFLEDGAPPIKVNEDFASFFETF